MIQISQESIEAMCNGIDRWADELKANVHQQAQAELNRVRGQQHFTGDAAGAYRQHFEDMVQEIQRAIERISDGQLAGMRNQLRSLGETFRDTDAQIARGLLR
jgi:hypothetical protein